MEVMEGRSYDGLEMEPRQQDGSPNGLQVSASRAGSELQKVADAVLTGDALLGKMLEIETVGVIFFDPAGDIVRANDAFLRMSGYTKEDVAMGRLRWDTLTPPEWMEASFQAIAQLQTWGSTTPYEKQYYRRDGSRFWGLFAAKGLSQREGVEFILDITERKRLEDELRRTYERQSNIARWLQDALQPALPAQPPPGLQLHAFYRPALDEASIGGDFYDVFALGDGRHALVVADLSGKGLAAATQIATVRHMLRALLYQHATDNTLLSQTVSMLSDMLTQHDLLTGFATLWVGIWNPADRTLTYVNAGQEPGLLRRAASNAVEELSATGPILGGFAGAAFREETVGLDPGDVLALFTDGLTEAGRSREEMLGVPGVCALFEASAQRACCPAQIVCDIIAGVEADATPSGMRDDVCLLAIRVE